MKEKRTVVNTGTHGPNHEKHAWFAQATGSTPARDDMEIVRQAFHRDYEKVVYRADTFDWLGYVRPGARIPIILAYANKNKIPLLILTLPEPKPDDEPPTDEPPKGWNPAWGEDPRE